MLDDASHFRSDFKLKARDVVRSSYDIFPPECGHQYDVNEQEDFTRCAVGEYCDSGEWMHNGKDLTVSIPVSHIS